MQKQYIAIYKSKEYSLQDIQDMIEVYDVRYWHRQQTWESPEEEDIDYKVDISAKFDKAVQIACIEFKDDDDELGEYIEFDGMKFKLVLDGHSWFDCLWSYGWDSFDGVSYLENLYNTEQEVRTHIENWIDATAEDNAWEVVKNGEARAW